MRIGGALYYSKMLASQHHSTNQMVFRKMDNKMPEIAVPLSENSAALMPGAVIGTACRLGADVVVPSHVRIGSRVTIDSHVAFGCFDLFEGTAALITIEDDVYIGPNATVLPGLRIGAKARILAGAVVSRDIPENAIVSGNPAAIIAYVDAAGMANGNMSSGSGLTKRHFSEAVGVGAVMLHHFPVITDIRGSLTVGEFERDIPFVPKRYFMVYDVPSKETRGEHAHRECHQFLICTEGSCVVVVDDGSQRLEVLLDHPSKGLHLPPMTWGIQYKYTKTAMLMVFASHHYDNADYIRSYADYLAAVHSHAMEALS
jgi:UDP-2-acetamido-3-amino-2,3-dideoxy-glucuronate N-acetyltransferase